MIRYAEERGIMFLKAGMLIAVPHGGIRAGLWKEAGALWSLWRQGRRQHIPFQFIFTPAGIRKVAPIQARGGIFIPSVCVIDLESLAQSITRDAQNAGAHLVYGSEVTGIRIDGLNYVVETVKGEIRSKTLINSAGLRAHEISKMAQGPNYEIEFLRGDYYELVGGIEKWKLRTLVYPAMPPGSRSKGVHFGPRTDGRLYIGPSASPAADQTPKQVFLDAARKFMPEVGEKDLEWAYAGVRPKRITRNGHADFTIRLDRTTPPLINLIGIDSPGLSASMAIARYVAGMIDSLGEIQGRTPNS
jgi:L-2-hydroxyglutarate oxidase LhgO